MKNKILKSIAYIVFTVAVFCGCMLDSENWYIFLGGLMICTAYLSLYYGVNRERFEREFS